MNISKINSNLSYTGNIPTKPIVKNTGNAINKLSVHLQQKNSSKTTLGSILWDKFYKFACAFCDIIGI